MFVKLVKYSRHKKFADRDRANFGKANVDFNIVLEFVKNTQQFE